MGRGNGVWGISWPPGAGRGLTPDGAYRASASFGLDNLFWGPGMSLFFQLVGTSFSCRFAIDLRFLTFCPAWAATVTPSYEVLGESGSCGQAESDGARLADCHVSSPGYCVTGLVSGGAALRAVQSQRAADPSMTTTGWRRTGQDGAVWGTLGFARK